MKDELTSLFEKLVSQYGIDTLETRRSDSLDFHELSVWSLRELLTSAYELGKAEGGPKKCV